MTGSYRTASAQLSEGRSEEGAQENSEFSNLLLSSECFYNKKIIKKWFLSVKDGQW